MDIQTEVQKIHHQFGISEKANYEIQKLFDKTIKEAVIEALRVHDVSSMLKAERETTKEEIREWLRSEDFEGIAERL